MDMGIIGGINLAYMLNASAIVSKGYVVNGERVGLTISSAYAWEKIPFQRDSGKYLASAKTAKAGSKVSHSVALNVLSLDTSLLYKYREKCRGKYIVAVVLNSGVTYIVGVESAMRLTMESYSAETPGDGIGFTLKFDCESRSDKETFVLAFTPPAKKPLLYNGYAVNDIRGIAPTGWHIPTKEEFKTLIAYLGGEFVAGGKLKKIGSDYWIDPNVGATDEVGFGLTGNGYRDNSARFQSLKAIASLWTITTGDFFGANFAYMVLASHTGIQLHFRDHTNSTGYAIRAIKNDSTNTGTVTDKDGNVYPTVKIGEQVWMAEDICVKHYNNGDPIPNITDNTEWAALTTGACCTYNNE